jgi:hypothetical protein
MKMNNAGNLMKIDEKGPVWGLDEDLLFSEFLESDHQLPDFEKWFEPTKLKDNRSILNKRSIVEMEELAKDIQDGKKGMKVLMDRFIPMRIDEEAACLLKTEGEGYTSMDQENLGSKGGPGVQVFARQAKSHLEKMYNGKSAQDSKRKLQLRILRFNKNNEPKETRKEQVEGHHGMPTMKEIVV